MLLWFSFCLLALAYAVVVLWYRWAWVQLPEYKSSPHFEPNTHITVIIPARNEATNIAACLSGIVAQQYPTHLLQVLVIDDASEDNTASVVGKFSAQYSFVHCIRLDHMPGMQSHKKRAIENGIANATGDLIVCTDADCLHHPRWLLTLVHGFKQGGVEFIAAPVVYTTRPSLLSVFQSLDFMTLQGITGASVSQRFHSMCNGANIAYTKKAFEEVNGFEGIDALPTGDDMLLMHKIFKLHPKGVVWLKSKEATVRTQPCATWQTFFQQRIRWASKAAYYDDRRMYWVLVLVYFFNLLLLILGLCSIFNQEILWPFLAGLAIKTAAELWFLWGVSGFFGLRAWLIVFPFLQPFHIAYTVAAGWLGRFGSYQWKGRVVRKPSALVK